MKTICFLAVCALLIGCASAQEQSSARLELFGGYQYVAYYTYPAYVGPWTKNGYNGFDGSAAFRFLPHLSAEGDFSYGHAASFGDSSPNLETYVGGPRVSFGDKRASVFAHALFGGLRHSYGSSSSAYSTFAVVMGGGLDVWFARHLGARPIQFDYLRTSTNVGSYAAAPGNHGNYRLSTGVIFRF